VGEDPGAPGGHVRLPLCASAVAAVGLRVVASPPRTDIPVVVVRAAGAGPAGSQAQRRRAEGPWAFDARIAARAGPRACRFQVC